MQSPALLQAETGTAPTESETVHPPSRLIKMASEEQIERKKKLEFKTLQLKVSEKLSRDNLKDLKHLVMDEIAKVRLEDVTEGIDLFAALEEKGMFPFS